MPKISYLITTLQHPVGSVAQSAASEITDIGALLMESSFTILSQEEIYSTAEPIFCFSAKDEVKL
jgi:hypothetical protein